MEASAWFSWGDDSRSDIVHVVVRGTSCGMLDPHIVVGRKQFRRLLPFGATHATQAMEANGQLDGGALVARMAAVAAARAEVLTEPQIPSGPNEQENRRIGRAAYITPALVLEPPDVVRRTLEEALRGRNGTAAAMHCRR